MATSFDGDNLVITLDPVVGGSLSVDVQNDLYEPWKEWMKLSDNSKYPQAFRSDGGAPLSGIINQGSYFFLNNTDGWRIKPAENDGTYTLVGNLALEDTELPAFVATTGAFTVAIIGLQPVTQGVTPSMASQLEFNVFQNVVCVDTASGYAGTEYNGNDPIGSRRAPSNNMADALTIAKTQGIVTFQVLSNLTVSTVDLSAGYKFIGDSPSITIDFQASANVSNCAVNLLTVSGELDGLNIIRDCSVGAVTNVSGFFEKSAFTSTVELIGDASFYECYSQVAGSGSPVFDVGSNNLVVRDFHGSLELTNMTGGASSVGIHGGRLTLSNTCTAGDVYMRGEPFELSDNSSGTTVQNQTSGLKVDEIWRRLGLDPSKPLTNKNDGGISATGIDIQAATSGADIIQTRQ